MTSPTVARSTCHPLTGRRRSWDLVRAAELDHMKWRLTAAVRFSTFLEDRSVNVASWAEQLDWRSGVPRSGRSAYRM
jgi:hypothetical protein